MSSANVGRRDRGDRSLGGVWAREHYDWSEPGLVRLRLVDAIDFRSGTVIDYHVTDRPGGGCHVAVDFQRVASSARGKFVGFAVQLDRITAVREGPAGDTRSARSPSCRGVVRRNLGRHEVRPRCSRVSPGRRPLQGRGRRSGGPRRARSGSRSRRTTSSRRTAGLDRGGLGGVEGDRVVRPDLEGVIARAHRADALAHC